MSVVGTALRSFYIILTLLAVIAVTRTSAQTTPKRKITAHVVALDQVYMYNRLGAAQPAGMIYALQRDIVAIDKSKPLAPGNVRLRDGKRPRPIVLRMNRGDELTIYFTNYLRPYVSTDSVSPYPPFKVSQGQLTNSTSLAVPATRSAGIHVMGMNVFTSITDDGSWVANDSSSLVAPGKSAVYRIYAPEEGAFLLYSTGANMGGPFNAGQLLEGLFGSVTVEPDGAEWYRSQVTNAALLRATTGWIDSNGNKNQNGNGLPIINYAAKDSTGTPVLAMLQKSGDSSEIIYDDLTAVITGPNAGRFPQADTANPTFSQNPAYPDRLQPYREVVLHYHEPLGAAVQAFPVFYSTSTTTNLTTTLVSGQDRFAINYGTGGIGAEIYANRIGVGPMAECVDCAYEEFFLSSWTVGDPAMVVDVPANAVGTSPRAVDSTLQSLLLDAIVNTQTGPQPTAKAGFKATEALYPDDPSNVYHSYLSDHVKFRIHHAGTGVTHLHHQHAHQWLRSPNSDNSEYLDSQTLDPGASFTLDMTYFGSGNKNLTVGDQIFHCHFYPHFAEGMWGMWRVHDVFEAGTVMQNVGGKIIPKPGSRALPDAEIAAGTPIPAVVPLPTIAMAPVPAPVAISNGQIIISDTTRNPGFPFFIPGIAGSRAPHPPLDFATGIYYDDSAGVKVRRNGILNGGLPRHLVASGQVMFSQETQFDWTKVIDYLTAIELPEGGTPVEVAAMNAHAIRNHPSYTPAGVPATYLYNGRPAVAGAPFADPAVDLNGNPVTKKRTYKGAAIQMDVVLNKAGWHYPQQRMLVLTDDIRPTIAGARPPQPLFFRANSDEYIEFQHTNLVPDYYQLDNFQVRTPTDIIGQHIHLVKFDVTSSDGAANGFNYEDGTFSPDMVRDRIHGINNGKLTPYKFVPGQPVSASASGPALPKLHATWPDTAWGSPPSYNHQSWQGAQTTIQRWYADPLLNNQGQDRTIRTVFTHDHFGPSTHQQVGLYAGLLVEPKGSIWVDPITGDTLGGENITKRADGGPTSWQANIVASNTAKSYREFALEFQDLQLAYTSTSKQDFVPYPVFPANWPADSAAYVAKVNAYKGWMDSSAIGVPSTSMSYAQLITSAGNLGTYSTNYRNEPLPLRTADSTFASRTTVSQARGMAGDLAYAYSSQVKRVDPRFNSQPIPGSTLPGAKDTNFRYPAVALTPGMNPGDPFTPMLRAYAGDSIQIRTLVGAHLLAHSFSMHGVNWKYEPSLENSGYKSSQVTSLSEHYEFFFRAPSGWQQVADSTDYLYNTSTGTNGQINGMWGLMRSFNKTQKTIKPLPNNPVSETPAAAWTCGCPQAAPVRKLNVVALTASQALDSTAGNPAKGALVYYMRIGRKGRDTILKDPNALMFFRLEDVDTTTWKYKPKTPVEPLVLRARAGECVQITLYNRLDTTAAVFTTQSTLVPTNTWLRPNAPTLKYTGTPSKNIGLNAQLLSYPVASNDGFNVGFNTTQTVAPKAQRTYSIYAGVWKNNGGTFTPQPVEFGTVSLASPDPLMQYTYGLFGTLVVEPPQAVWREDVGSHAAATVYPTASDSASGSNGFREFVMMLQNNTKAPGVTAAVNYKSAPASLRMKNSATPFAQADITGILADSTTTTTLGGLPPTPTFTATAGTPVRIRMSHPYGTGVDDNVTVHGHVWQEEPYKNASTALGYNPLSQWQGSRSQLASLNTYDMLIDKAGGVNAVPGDYLYRTYIGGNFTAGIWGIMTVTPRSADAVRVLAADVPNSTISGEALIDPRTGAYAGSVAVYVKSGTKETLIDNLKVNAVDGTWALDPAKLKPAARKELASALAQPNASIVVRSANGGTSELLVAELKTLQPTRELVRVLPSGTAAAARNETVDPTLLIPGVQPSVSP